MSAFSCIIFSVLVFLGVGIGLHSSKIKSIFFSILFIAVASFLVVSIPVITITVFRDMSGGHTGLLPMVIPLLSLVLFAISVSAWVVARFKMNAESNFVRFFAKTSHTVLYILVLLLLLGFGVSISSAYQDQVYAKKYFRNIAHQQVLESRKWLPGNVIFGCTYAIVSLQNNASLEPPKQWLPGITWYRTPLRFKKDARNFSCRNIICNCKKDWNPEIYRSLTRALNQPGSFYYTNRGGPPYDELSQGVLYIYSKTENVAARVEYGD